MQRTLKLSSVSSFTHLFDIVEAHWVITMKIFLGYYIPIFASFLAINLDFMVRSHAQVAGSKLFPNQNGRVNYVIRSDQSGDVRIDLCGSIR